MRTMLPFLLLIAVGCQHCPRFFDCSSTCTEKEICKEEIVPCPPSRIRREKVCKEPCVETCDKEKPTIECKQPETIHVKLPPQKIIVQQQAAPQPQAMMAQPQALAQPQAYAMVPASNVESQAVGRARMGLTFDFVRVPIPFPRLIAVPTQQRMQAVPVAMMQSVAAPQAMAVAPQAMPQAMMAPQAQATHAIVRMQGHTTVPVQTQAVVPFEQHAIVPLGAAGLQTQGMMVAPQAQGMMVAPQGVQAQPQGMTIEQAEQFCEMVRQMKARMK